jgi:hypothetical protein
MQRKLLSLLIAILGLGLLALLAPVEITLQGAVAMAALTAILAMVNSGQERDEPRLSERERLSQRETARGLRPHPGESFKKPLRLLGFLVTCFLLFAILAIDSHNRPLEQTQVVEETRYTHRAQFGYIFNVAPSEQFVRLDTGSLGLATMISADEHGPTAITTFGRTLQLEFSYFLEGLDDEQLWIEINGEVFVRAGNGWRKDVMRLPMRNFTGKHGAVSTLVEMQQVGSLIDSIEEQADESPGPYEMVFAPRVVLRGETVDDVFQPDFVIEIENNQIRPDVELERLEHRTEPVMTSLSNMLPPVLGLTLSVERARVLGLYGALITGVATFLLGAWIGWTLFTIPTARIAARYGKMLVEVDTVENPGTRRIKVQSIRDVARVARRSGQPILHHEDESQHLYCVADGESMYTYSLLKGPEEQ